MRINVTLHFKAGRKNGTEASCDGTRKYDINLISTQKISLAIHQPGHIRRLKNLHYFCSLSVRKMAREYPRSTSCFFGISGQHIYWVSWHGLWTSHWVSAVLGVRSNFMVRWIARYYAKRASCDCQACLRALKVCTDSLHLSLWLWQPAGEQQTTSESAQNKPLSPPQVALAAADLNVLFRVNALCPFSAVCFFCQFGSRQRAARTHSWWSHSPCWRSIPTQADKKKYRD